MLSLNELSAKFIISTSAEASHFDVVIEIHVFVSLILFTTRSDDKSGRMTKAYLLPRVVLFFVDKS